MSSKNAIFKVILPYVIAISGLVIGYQILYANDIKPTPTLKQQAQKRLRIVQVEKLERGTVTPNWLGTAYVKPSDTIKVHAKVSGDVIAVNELAKPGKKLHKSDWLVQLDPTDFELSLKSQKAQLAQANANYALEQADQVLAKEELSLLSQRQDKENNDFEIEQDLVLRKPQLAVAGSKVQVAKINVEKAQLNFDRTKVTMPFDGKIINKNIGVGSKVSSGTALFSITNTEKYWLEVKIPHAFLPLLDKNQAYQVTNPRVWGKGKSRKAQFLSILPELDNRDRQIKMLLQIDQPLDQEGDKPAVFINDFVTVELKGKTINNAWTIKHHWLQADNTVWVVDGNSTLQKRAVDVLFKGRELIYIDADFKQGDLALAEKPGIANVGLPVKVKMTSLQNSQTSNSESLQRQDKKRLKRQNKKAKGALTSNEMQGK